MKNKLKDTLNAYFAEKKKKRQEAEAKMKELIDFYGKARVQPVAYFVLSIAAVFVLALASYVVGLIHFLVTGVANLDGWGWFVVLLVSFPFFEFYGCCLGYFSKTNERGGIDHGDFKSTVPLLRWQV